MGRTTAPPRLYLGGQSDRLLLIDLSNPHRPTATGSIHFEQWLTGAAVKTGSAGRVYAYTGETGACSAATTMRGFACKGILRVWDISNPAAPNQLAELATPAPPIEFVIKGGYAYLVEQHCDMDAGCHGGLEWLDLANPAEPRSLGFVEAWSRSLVVADGFAFADDLQIWDVAHPAPQPLAAAGAIKGQVASVVGKWAYLFDQADFFIVDVSDPTAPREIGRYRQSGPVSPASLGLSPPYLYVTDYVRGLLVIDLTDPAAPKEVGAAEYDHQNLTYLVQRAEADKFYLSDDTAAVLQISIPAIQPGPGCRSIRTCQPAGEGRRQLCLRQHPLGLANCGSDRPCRSIEAGFYALPKAAGGGGGLWPVDDYLYLTEVDDYAYLSAPQSTLRVIDVSDPARPRQVEQWI